MSQQFTETVEILNDEGKATIVLVGGSTSPPPLSATVGSLIQVKNLSGKDTIQLWGKDGKLTLGGSSVSGSLVLTQNDARGSESISFNGREADLRMGGQKSDRTDGVDGNIWLFAKNGDRTKDATATIQLDGGDSGIRLRDTNGNTTIGIDGRQANLRMGGKKTDGKDGVDGDIWLFAKNGDRTKDETATIHLDADASAIEMKNAKGISTIYLNSNRQAGTEAEVEKGYGAISLSKADGKTTIFLDGREGDIVLGNADCAEDFDITVSEAVEPGTVMVIDEAGGLRPSTEAYDKKVAGVISGAGDFKPGMVLDRQPGQNNRMPVALMGKVYCKVDARYAPIEVGDLLTTSQTPGHAMKATEPTKAFGTVIGKALRPLKEGQGLVPILIALQ